MIWRALLDSWRVLAVSVAVRVLMLVFAIASPVLTGSTVDLYRFEQIARSPGRPWIDQPVEYPPVQVLVIEAFAGDGAAATRDRLAVLSFVGDLGTAAALAWGWGRRHAVAYLLLTAPLLTILYWRLDPLFVAVAVLSVALARRGAARAAGIGLSIGALARLWPIVLVPLTGHERFKRVAGAFTIFTVVGTVVWVAIGGLDAPRQVGTFRGARGWSADSLVGSVMWILGGAVETEQGSIRIGVVQPWQRLLLAFAMFGTLIWIWKKAWHRAEPTGVGAAAAVAALLVFSPLSSVQFVTWLMPWAAVASVQGARDRTTAVFAALASIAAGVWIFGDIAGQDGVVWPMKAVFVGKNVAVLGVLVSGIHALRGASPAHVGDRRAARA